MILGRPRRLEPGSHVIKISVPPELMPQLDRLRLSMGLTRPGLVRDAIQRLLEKYGDGIGIPAPNKPATKKPASVVRCLYLKVPVSKGDIDKIDTLRTAMGKTRQQLILLAVLEIISKYI